MTSLPPASFQSLSEHAALQSPLPLLTQAPALRFAAPMTLLSPQVRLIRLDEINEERHQAYRQALANVYATLDAEQPVRLLYLLDAGAQGVDLYFGVVADTKDVDLHEAMKNLRGALEGQLPGINFDEDSTDLKAKNALLDRLCQAVQQGMVSGTPTGHEQDPAHEEQNFQSIDRLVRALQSGSRTNTTHPGRWQMVIIGQPLTSQQVRQQLDAAYALSSQLAGWVSTSVQVSGNNGSQHSTSSSTGESRASNTSQSTTRGTSNSKTRGNSDSHTDGKNEGGTTTKNWGTSSNKNASSSSTGESSGQSQAKNAGTSSSRTQGTSDSATQGTSASTSDTQGQSLTQTSNDSTSQSDSSGSALSVTQDITDKRIQHLLDYVDKQLIPRLQKGLTKALFQSSIYVAADNQSLYQRLKQTLRATFQGSETTLSPLQVHDLPPHARGQLLRLPTMADDMPQHADALLFHSLLASTGRSLGSLITADEMAIVASLPQRELQGIRRRKTVDFIVHLPTPTQDTLDVGSVIDRGRRYPNNRVCLAKSDLNKHVFVTGVTGAGKTTTCLNLLLESGLPFLVIEPAKTEYRELATRLDHVDYYRPNGDKHQSLRINPFALVRSDQRIKSHAGFLKNVFAAVFPMEASMPMMVEAAIIAAYEDKGWDVDDNEFLPGGDPFDPLARAWPTMSDMIGQLDRLIPTYGLGKEFEEKYRGSLVSRLRSLTDGTLGQVLDVPQSLSFDALLDRRAVIELEELQGGEEKALLMALLLGGINEAIRARHARHADFRHLTLIEEAHRLLARPEPGDRATALAVEAFADMLAEVRKYGEGLIIADQIPAKLIPDVIKNTHTKIVHRLFAEDDRRAMGETMMMNDEQCGFLPNLGTGEAIVFCGGWHGPAHAAIRSDHAQTDNQHQGFGGTGALSTCGERQLWRERQRYYPRLCQSVCWWATEDGNATDAAAGPSVFAQFVRETRQAQNQLLRLCQHWHTPNAHTASVRSITGAFERLRQWYTHWQPRAHQHLACAWTALLLDANPRPWPQQKDVPPIASADDAQSQHILQQAGEQLMQLLARSTSLADLQTAIQKEAAWRDLNAHCNHLARFKSF